MVDSTKTEDFQRAAAMLRVVQQQSRHVLVAANKHDVPGAVPLAKIAAALQVPADQVMSCDARDPEASKAVLQALVQRILPGVAT